MKFKCKKIMSLVLALVLPFMSLGSYFIPNNKKEVKAFAPALAELGLMASEAILAQGAISQGAMSSVYYSDEQQEAMKIQVNSGIADLALSDRTECTEALNNIGEEVQKGEDMNTVDLLKSFAAMPTKLLFLLGGALKAQLTNYNNKEEAQAAFSEDLGVYDLGLNPTIKIGSSYHRKFFAYTNKGLIEADVYGVVEAYLNKITTDDCYNFFNNGHIYRYRDYKIKDTYTEAELNEYVYEFDASLPLVLSRSSGGYSHSFTFTNLTTGDVLSTGDVVASSVQKPIYKIFPSYEALIAAVAAFQNISIVDAGAYDYVNSDSLPVPTTIPAALGDTINNYYTTYTTTADGDDTPPFVYTPAASAVDPDIIQVFPSDASIDIPDANTGAGEGEAEADDTTELGLLGSIVSSLAGLKALLASLLLADQSFDFEEFNPDNIQLKNIFPFSLPYDFYNLFKMLDAEPVTPEFDMTIDLSHVGVPGDPIVMHMDLSEWSEGAQIVKIALYIAFLIGLIFITRDLLKL